MSGKVVQFPGAATPAKLEVHEHSYVTGPRAGRGEHLVHSHPGGEVPHTHPETGPSSYTIDRDEWRRATGADGGARKKFTAKPSGEQLPTIPREETSFEVVVCGPPPPGFTGSGGGHYAAARMALGFRLTPLFRSGADPDRRRGG